MNTNVGRRFGQGRLVTPIVAAIITIAGIASAVAQETPPAYYGPHMWGGGWFFGPFMMLLFLGVAVAVVGLVGGGVWGAGPGHNARAPPSEALAIPRARDARGGVDKGGVRG